MAAGLPSLDLLSMAQAQQADAEIQAYRMAITGLVLSDVPFQAPTQPCCVTPRPVLPGPLFPAHGGEPSLMPSIASHIQALKHLGRW